MADQHNPPAFPSVCLNDPDHPASVPGMSLRDWFAGQALAGDLAAQNEFCGVLENTASDESLRDRAAAFYRFADAMLAARKID